MKAEMKNEMKYSIVCEYWMLYHTKILHHHFKTIFLHSPHFWSFEGPSRLWLKHSIPDAFFAVTNEFSDPAQLLSEPNATAAIKAGFH